MVGWWWEVGEGLIPERRGEVRGRIFSVLFFSLSFSSFAFSFFSFAPNFSSPGMILRSGKWPVKKLSLAVTFCFLLMEDFVFFSFSFSGF